MFSKKFFDKPFEKFHLSIISLEHQCKFDSFIIFIKRTSIKQFADNESFVLSF